MFFDIENILMNYVHLIEFDTFITCNLQHQLIYIYTHSFLDISFVFPFFQCRYRIQINGLSNGPRQKKTGEIFGPQLLRPNSCLVVRHVKQTFSRAPTGQWEGLMSTSVAISVFDVWRIRWYFYGCLRNSVLKSHVRIEKRSYTQKSVANRCKEQSTTVFLHMFLSLTPYLPYLQGFMMNDERLQAQAVPSDVRLPLDSRSCVTDPVQNA